MKRSIQILAILFLSAIACTSCVFMEPSIKGNGNVVEETRRVGDFDEIKVSRGMNVYITQSSSSKVVVKADENLLDIIETRVEGNTLNVTSKQNIRRATSKKVYISVSDLSKITATAGSNVFSESELQWKNLELKCTAGSNMKLEVKARELKVSTSSGSNIKLEGKADKFVGKATSGSNLKAGELTTEKCEVRVSSGANIWISAKDNLNAHASSGGNIFYSGRPETTDIEKSSGGNVIKR